MTAGPKKGPRTAKARAEEHGPRRAGDLTLATLRVGPEEYAIWSYPIADRDLPNSLTASEHHVIAAVLAGRSNADIARDRGTSRHTVANQIATLFRKLGVRSRAELAARLVRGSGGW